MKIRQMNNSANKKNYVYKYSITKYENKNIPE